MLLHPLDWLTFDAVGSGGGFLSWLGADRPDAEALRVPIGMTERVVLSVGFLLFFELYYPLNAFTASRETWKPLTAFDERAFYPDLCLRVRVDLLHFGCSGFSLPEPVDSTTVDCGLYDDERHFVYHFFGLPS